MPRSSLSITQCSTLTNGLAHTLACARVSGAASVSSSSVESLTIALDCDSPLSRFDQKVDSESTAICSHSLLRYKFDLLAKVLNCVVRKIILYRTFVGRPIDWLIFTRWRLINHRCTLSGHVIMIRSLFDYYCAQSSTIFPELPDFISSIASLNCV